MIPLSLEHQAFMETRYWRLPVSAAAIFAANDLDTTLLIAKLSCWLRTFAIFSVCKAVTHIRWMMMLKAIARVMVVAQVEVVDRVMAMGQVVAVGQVVNIT
jgi:hypothetical protein